MATTLIIDSVQDISKVAQNFLKQFSKPRVIAFVGSMGAGKTTFIKAVCHELGVIDTVNSPTFAIVNEYKTKASGNIYHFDLYRIEQSQEVQDIGFEDYLYSGNWCFIEWPEIAEEYFPKDLVVATIEELENGKRKISIQENN